MIDEKNIFKITYKDREIELKADFKAFKKLNKLTGNAFLVIDEFANDTDKRLEHLPIIIQAMSEEELTIQEIEENVLGMNYINVLQMSNIIFNILSMELINETLETEKIEKNVKSPVKKKKVKTGEK